MPRLPTFLENGFLQRDDLFFKAITMGGHKFIKMRHRSFWGLSVALSCLGSRDFLLLDTEGTSFAPSTCLSSSHLAVREALGKFRLVPSTYTVGLGFPASVTLGVANEM